MNDMHAYVHGGGKREVKSVVTSKTKKKKKLRSSNTNMVSRIMEVNAKMIMTMMMMITKNVENL